MAERIRTAPPLQATRLWQPVAVDGRNRKLFSPPFTYLGPVPEYGTDLGLEGVRGRKSLKWGVEKIGKVRDRGRGGGEKGRRGQILGAKIVP